MAAGEGGKDENAHALAGAEPGIKGKKNSKAAASFFTPSSKKSKVAVAKVEVEVGQNVEGVEERKDDEFQGPPAILAAVLDKKKPSKKKAKVLQYQARDVENASPVLDAQTEGLQPDFSLEQKQEAAPSPTKKQSRASPAKKKRKAQQNVIESKPSVGVHGPDLFLQARLAAEENARLSAGKATHPFFARPKPGGARSLVTDEAAQSTSGRSLDLAPDLSEKNLRMSPSKPPHPFFGRHGSAKPMAVDESPSIYESDSLPPSLPLHITQNMPEEEANLPWCPDWKWRNMPVKSNGENIEGTWSFASDQPSCTWTWPSSKKRKRKGRPISRVAAFGRVIEYLTGKEAGTRYLLGEEVESVAADTQKLVEKLSSYYYPNFEQNSAERQVRANSRNPLWTDQYQPQNSQEVCGNNECVKILSSWLQQWGEKILQQKRASKNKDEAESSSSDDDSDFEDSPSEINDDDDDLQNCLLVTGPVGCGKSAAIYACSMEHGFTVIEVNASECRSGALIKHKFKEAMESHGLSKRRSSTRVEASDGQLDVEQIFKQGEGCRRSIFCNDEPENQVSQSQGANRSNLPPSALRGLRVILFEDVDIVFEEDAGFLGALTLLARTSKCPIIFTSNCQKPVLPQVIGLQVLRFEQPSTAELVAHAYMVCMAEGVSCCPYIVEHIVKTSGHDLRKLLMLLQYWTQGSPTDSTYLKDVSAVESSKVLQSNKQNPNLVNCLLQLDGCPQVPATRIQAADKKLSDEDLNTIEPEHVCSEPKPGNDLNSGIFRKPGVNANSKKRSLDSGWLYAHDCQHRVLPLLIRNMEPCQMTAIVAGYLEEANKEVMALTDNEVAQWSRCRYDKLKAREEADFQARKMLRKLQAAARKELNGKPSEDFSFMKLMQSSYDSPAAQTASNECNRDTLFILQEHERCSSEEREGDFVPACLLNDGDMCEQHPSGATANGLTHENEECTNLLPVPDTNPQNSSEIGWTILEHNCTSGLRSSVSILETIDLGGNFSHQNIDLPVATAEAGSQSAYFAVENSAPLGLEDVPVHKPLTQGEQDATPIPFDILTIHHDVGTQFSAGKQACNEGASLEDRILNLASTKMEQLWSQMRSLQLQKAITPEMEANIILDDVLHDLSACDYLSSRTASTSKVSMEQTIEYNDYPEDNSWNNCTESAAVLAQLRLNQALNSFLPPNGLHSDTWQVGPSVSQQETIREEKQACEDERLDLLLPQRCRLLGRLARLDYFLFHSQLTPPTPNPEGRVGRATRQRKFI